MVEPPPGPEETIVEPKQSIRFRCVVEGRPAPTVSYTWLPFNETESGQEPVQIPVKADKSGEHRYASDVFETSTSTKRSLLCQARNPEGTQTDGHIFNVLSKRLAPKLSV